MEAEIASLTATRNALANRGEALRATGTKQKQATAALLEDIVSGACVTRPGSFVTGSYRQDYLSLNLPLPRLSAHW